MPKRKLFSRKDGTTFKEDVQDISQDVKAFFQALPAKLKTWIAEAEVIVDALEKLEQALKDGQPADEAIDYVLNLTKTELDDRFYEAFKEALSNFIVIVGDAIEDVEDFSGSIKFETASDYVAKISELTRVEADTTTQIAVYFYKG